MVPLSILDLSPILEGGDAAQSFRHTLDLARHGERWGYQRFWLAEHHNMPGVASAATAVVIGHVAAGTSRIRVGAGGVMLPNHAPLVIAEQFGTLASLFPGRIDLGLGRAPGTDPLTTRALRRHAGSADTFPDDVLELMGYFQPPRADVPVRAVPGAGLDVPVWILGSSLFGAQLAAALGLPYAFASHFAPAQLLPAIDVYRERFRPSARLEKPHLMLGVNVFAADTDAAAARLSSSLKLAFAALRRGRPGPLKPPVDDVASALTPVELASLEQVFSCSVVGSPETVRRGLEAFAARTGADELMVTSQIFDHAARLRSFEIAAAAGGLAPAAPASTGAGALERFAGLAKPALPAPQTRLPAQTVGPCLQAGLANPANRSRAQVSFCPETAKRATSAAATASVAAKSARLVGRRQPIAAPAPAKTASAIAAAQRQGGGAEGGPAAAPPGPNKIASEATKSSAGPATAVTRAPSRWGSPRTPVAASSARSGSTLARCAATPNSAPAAIAQGAGQGAPGSARVAATGRAPKPSA